jgi:iron complex outermembrane receptor protein
MVFAARLRKGTRVSFAVLLALVCLAMPAQAGPTGTTSADLEELSLEDLLQIEVTSVSKRAQKISQSPAAVTVITNEEIRRSGMTTIPDLLRLVPGLHVASIDANKWAVTARGFNNEFANKLLVMIDGRSVYTPLFSGVYWDVQDVVFEDIDRIEVIRGPGGTVWGANAVNGVINIITKSAEDTHGLFVEGGGGTQEQGFGSGRWGGAVGEDLHYRGYVKGFTRDNYDYPFGREANDAWDQVRGGFRLDWDITEATSFTFQGDYYDGESHSTIALGQPITEDLSGGNLLARWNHEFGEANEGSLQFYYDRTKRHEFANKEKRERIDADWQHYFEPAPWVGVTWGAGYRFDKDNFEGLTGVVSLGNPRRTTHLVSAFVQGDFEAIEDRLRFTVGSKFEHNSHTNFEWQPSGRVLYTPHEDHTVWAAVSRAVRTPSRAEEDIRIVLRMGPTTQYNFGRRGINSEIVYAYELGYRAQLLEYLSFDIAGYFNDYDKLVTGEVSSVSYPCFPFGTCTDFTKIFHNKGDAYGWGVETSVTWTATEWLSFTANYTYMELDTRSGNSTDPDFHDKENEHADHQISLRARVDLPMNFEFDTQVFYVGDVNGQSIDSYGRVDVRLGWRPIEAVEISLVGQNLQASNHDEWGSEPNLFATEVPRSFYGKVAIRWP